MRCLRRLVSVFSSAGLVFAAILGGQAVPAAEVTVQNDSVENFQTVPIVGDFSPGEEAAVVLTAPCDGSIVALQIVWLAGNPAAPQDIEQAIWVYGDGGTFPNPGETLLFLDSPLLTPGAINEFRFLDEQNAIPIDVPVTAGMNFFVSLEYANATDVLDGTPSIPRDTNGCQDGRNALFANSWFDFCILLNGDLAIRAVVDCQDPVGACCDFNAFCSDDVELNDCTAAGSTFFQGQTCAQIECPAPVGACCNGQGGCLENQEETFCSNVLGSIYGGNGTTCAEGVCDLQACCLADGVCQDLIESACLGQSGTPQGPGSDCVSADCPQPNGACCVNDVCVANQTQAQCLGFDGTWQGPQSSCDSMPCANGCPKVSSGGACPACDLNENGATEGLDIAIITSSANFGKTVAAAADPCADVNGSGAVEGLDVAFCTSTACFGL